MNVVSQWSYFEYPYYLSLRPLTAVYMNAQHVSFFTRLVTDHRTWPSFECGCLNTTLHLYTLYAEKWSMYLRKKQRHTCNRQSSARTWSDLLQVRRLWFHSMWEGEAEKRNSIKTESDAIQRNLKLFNFFFFDFVMLFLSYLWVQENVHWAVWKQFQIFVWFFSPLPLSLSKERGVWEGVWIFLIICFEILLVVFLWNAY